MTDRPDQKSDDAQPKPETQAAVNHSETLISVDSSTVDVTRELPAQVAAASGRNAAQPEIPAEFGRYRVERLLGRGGMGSVWLAQDTQLHRKVALKIPAFARDCPPELLQRFFREARSAATLNHPNICPVYDVGEHDGIHYISMGFVEGRPLADYIKSTKEQRERPVAIIVRKIALALQEAHEKGIIHRDLKPANIMINQRNEPIVMDFGLARQIQEDQDVRMTREGLTLGSPGYMSPEQVEGRPDIGPATDIYSLGVVLYELLTGDAPFHGNVLSVLHQITQSQPKPLQELRPDLSSGLVAICQKAMAKRPEDRFGSMQLFAQALATFLKADSTQESATAPLPVPDPAPPAELPVAPPRGTSPVRPRPESRLLPKTSVAVPATRRRRTAVKKREQGAWPAWWYLTGGGVIAALGIGVGIALSSRPAMEIPPVNVPPASPLAASAEKTEVVPTSQSTDLPAEPKPSPSTSEPSLAASETKGAPGTPLVDTGAETSATNMPAPEGANSPQRPAAATPGGAPPAALAAANVPPPNPTDASPPPSPPGQMAGQPPGAGNPSTQTMPSPPGQGQPSTPGQMNAPPQLPGRNPLPPGANPNSPFGSFTPELSFAEYDRDHNKLLTPDEFPLHIILRADSNRDHRLTTREFETAQKKLGKKLFEEPTGPPPGFPGRPGFGPGRPPSN